MRYGYGEEDCDEIPERDWDGEWRDFAADRLLYWKSPSSYMTDPYSFMTEEEEDFWDNEVPVRRIRLSDGFSTKAKSATSPESAAYTSGKEDGSATSSNTPAEGGLRAEGLRHSPMHEFAGKDGQKFSGNSKWDTVFEAFEAKSSVQSPISTDRLEPLSPAQPPMGEMPASKRYASVSSLTCSCCCTTSVCRCMLYTMLGMTSLLWFSFFFFVSPARKVLGKGATVRVTLYTRLPAHPKPCLWLRGLTLRRK